MEEYYQKVIKLQEQLRKSEDERLNLEMKFNETLQLMKQEDEIHMKKFRSRYKKFMDEDRRRQHRNDKILEALDRIENRTSMWETKTQKFKSCRKNYQDYLKNLQEYKNRNVIDTNQADQRSYLTDSTLREDTYKSAEVPYKSTDLLLKEYQPDPTHRKVLDNSEQLKKYSNLGNVNSIYSRLPREKSYGEIKSTKDYANILTQNNDTGTRDDYSGRPDYYNGYSGDYAAEFEPIGVDINAKLERGSQDHLPSGSSSFTNKLSQEALPVSSEEVNDTIGKHEGYKSKFLRDLENSSFDHDFDKNEKLVESQQNGRVEKVEDASLGTALQPTEQFVPSAVIQDKTLEAPSKPVAPTVQPRQVKSKIEVDQSNKLPSKVEKPEVGEEQNSEIKLLQQSDRSETALTPQPSHRELDQTAPNSDNQQPLQHEEHQHESKERVKQFSGSRQPSQQLEESKQTLGYDGHQEEPLPSESGQALQQYEEPEQPLQEYIEPGQPLQQYDESGQPLQQYDETGQPLQQYDENGQLLQYDENGQILQQYDETEPPLQQYDETGQLVQQYDQSGQEYDASGQPLQQYDEAGQFLPQQYDENGQPLQQYDENGQPMQQYAENALPLQYDENGQPLQQYDANGQPLQNLQFDENGQPLQYDENGQLVQQYDVSGQPYQQYDETGQALQYDENGQPIQYDQSGQPYQQYDENGQPLQYDESGQPLQYDENGQPLQYDENGQLYQQYDENGQPGQEYDQSAPPVSKPNVLEMLETDTESFQQESKVSNDSDFDVSNAA